MSLQLLILKSYETLYKWMQAWILPFLLFLAYLTAYGLLTPDIVDSVSKAHLSAVHLVIGLFIISFTILVAYDSLIIWYYKRKGQSYLNPERKIFFNANQNNKLRTFVSWLFYLCLVALSSSGGLLFLAEFKMFHLSIPVIVYLFTIHRFAAILITSVIIVKYYLKLFQWLKSLNQYLREY